jgi:hypothetical protein
VIDYYVCGAIDAINNWLGDTEILGGNLNQCRFVHHKSHITSFGKNTGRRGGKPAIGRLSYGTEVTKVKVKLQKEKKGN